MSTIRSLTQGLLLMLVLLVISVPSNAQDDPRYDNTVGITLPFLGPGPITREISVITTPDGFDNFDLGVDQAEPHLSVHPRNPLWYFSAWNINNVRRTINGHDWTFSSPSFGATMRGDPVTAYDSLGNLYYENMYGATSIQGCMVMRSTDNGATWLPSVAGIAGIDKNWIACDQTSGPYANFVYTTMTASGGGNFARSTNFGATWTNTATFTPQTLPGMMVAVGPNVLGGNNISGGCVYVVTHSGTNAAGTYTFSRSTNGGLNFTLMSTQQFSGLIGTEISGRSTVNGMRTRPYPFIVADNSFGPHRGRLYLVYATNNPAGNGNKSDIFLHYSTDQGATWSTRTRVNDDPNPQNNFSFFPAVWTEKTTGRLYIKWYDSRLVPTSDSMDVYATYSDDGGLTFAPNQRMTNRTFRTKVTTSGNPPAYQGDYDAIVSHQYGALAVWADFRGNNFGSYAGYFPDFAMLVSPTRDTLDLTDSATIIVKVPAVKLYTHVARFSASFSPAGNISITFPQRDSLTAYPDSLPMVIRTNNAAQGTYTVTVTGTGPTGTPIHRRTITILVQPPPNAVRIIQPNGGEFWTVGTDQNITWTRSGLVDSVNLDYSTNYGVSWIRITTGVPAAIGTYAWTIPNTPTTEALVRASWKANPTLNDASDAIFTISSLPLTEAWTDHVTAAFRATVTNEGNIGSLNDYVGTGPGNGFQFNPVNVIGQRLFEGALIIATDSLRVSDAARDSIEEFDADFRYRALFDTTGSAAPLQMRATSFDDSPAESPLGIRVDQTTLSVDSTGLNNFLIFQLDVRNQSNSTFNGLTIGGFFDWDVAASADDRGSVIVDSTNTIPGVNGGAPFPFDMLELHAGISPNAWVGIVPLSTNRFRGRRILISSTEVYPPRMRNSDKWEYINFNRTTNPNGDAGTPDDHCQIFGMGQYALAPAATKRVGFAMVAGTSLQNFISAARAAQLFWVQRMGNLMDINLTDVPHLIAEIPTKYKLGQNYPNPFNPTTTIRYALPQTGLVELSVFNVLGQKIATLVNGQQTPGDHAIVWDASSVSSGVYFYRITAGSYVETRKMILMK